MRALQIVKSLRWARFRVWFEWCADCKDGRLLLRVKRGDVPTCQREIRRQPPTLLSVARDPKAKHRGLLGKWLCAQVCLGLFKRDAPTCQLEIALWRDATEKLMGFNGMLGGCQRILAVPKGYVRWNHPLCQRLNIEGQLAAHIAFQGDPRGFFVDPDEMVHPGKIIFPKRCRQKTRSRSNISAGGVPPCSWERWSWQGGGLWGWVLARYVV